MGHLSDIFFKKYTSWIRWLHCLQSTFHFLEFILKSATIALISLHWIIGFGLNVWLNSEEIRQTTFNIKSWRTPSTHLLRQLQMNRFWKLCLTLQPEPDVVFRSMVALLSINSRKWNVDCKQCNHLIHDIYFLKNISLKCPNQTIKMTQSF